MEWENNYNCQFINDRNKSGRDFIAYRGNEVSYDQIILALNKKCLLDYDDYNNFRIFEQNGKKKNIIFAKIVLPSLTRARDPYWKEIFLGDGFLSVNGYHQDEFKNACIHFPESMITDPDKYHQLTNYLYQEYTTSMFEKLSKYNIHFCSVIWDSFHDSMIAGVTEPKGQYTHLYYGYTKNKQELMFSNAEDLLKFFCLETHEMAPNTYMKDGRIYSFDGIELEKDNKIASRKFIENLLKNNSLTEEEKIDIFFTKVKSLDEEPNQWKKLK